MRHPIFRVTNETVWAGVFRCSQDTAIHRTSSDHIRPAENLGDSRPYAGGVIVGGQNVIGIGLRYNTPGPEDTSKNGHHRDSKGKHADNPHQCDD